MILIFTPLAFFWEFLLGRAYLWEDFLLQVYPFRQFAATTLNGGELPLWNPYTFGGMPFQADIQSGVFYLPNLLMSLCVRHGVLSFYALQTMVIAHYPLAAVGMYFLARELKLERIYATFAGLVFALSGFMIVHAIHPGFVEQAAWIPWILLALHRSIHRRSIRYALLTGVLTGHAVLAGAPQISLFTFYLILACGVFSAVNEWKRAGMRPALVMMALPILAVVVALGLAAIQLLPTLELAPLSERDSLTFQAAQAGQLPWKQLITGLIPKLFGVHGASERTWWGTGIYGAYWETAFYWGLPALMLAAFGAVCEARERFVRILIGAIVFCLLFAVGDQFVLYRVLFDWAPGVSAFRVPARILLVATIAISLLSAIGLRVMVDRAINSPAVVRRFLLGATGLIGAVWLAAHLGVFLPAAGHPRLVAIESMIDGESNLALLTFFGTCGLSLLMMRRRTVALLGFTGMFVLQVVDIWRFGGSQNSGKLDADAYYHGQPEVAQWIARIQQEQMKGFFRTTSRDGRQGMFERNTGMLDRLYLTEGYTPLNLRRKSPPASTTTRSLDLLSARFRATVDSTTGIIGLQPAESALPHAWFVPKPVVITDDAEMESYLKRAEFDPRAEVVVAESLRQLPPAADPGNFPASASIGADEYAPNSLSLEVAAPTNGMLVLSELYYPGWNALVDGESAHIYRADGSLRGLLLRPGMHMISMRFRPASFTRGAFITLSTVGLTFVLFFMFRQASEVRLSATG